MTSFRSNLPEVFLGKGVLKICYKFTGEQPCRSAILLKLQNNFIEIALRHGCSLVNLLHVFRTPFPKIKGNNTFHCIFWWTNTSTHTYIEPHRNFLSIHFLYFISLNFLFLFIYFLFSSKICQTSTKKFFS